jgi:hypothetical protein
MHADRFRAHANVAAADGRNFAFRDSAQAFGSRGGGIFRLVLSRDDEPPSSL